MAATGDIGYQDRLEYESAPLGSGSWNTVYQVRSITPPKKTASKTNFTTLESPNRTNEFKPGMGEWSSATFEGIYDPPNATHGQLLVDTDTYPQRNFRILFRNSITLAIEKTQTWLGHVEDCGVGTIEIDGARTLAGTIAVDGNMAIT